jgi:SRSO17 transposase
VPGDVQFSSKTDLARLMLGRALDAGVPASWATADEAYGKEGEFRGWLEQRRVSYVVAVPKSQAVAGRRTRATSGWFRSVYQVMTGGADAR